MEILSILPHSGTVRESQHHFQDDPINLPMHLSLRVQVPNSYILTQNLYYNYHCPKPKHLIIGYLDPLGFNVLTCLHGLHLENTSGLGAAELHVQTIEASKMHQFHV